MGNVGGKQGDGANLPPMTEAQWERVSSAMRYIEENGAFLMEGTYRVSGLMTDIQRGVRFLREGPSDEPEAVASLEDLRLPEWSGAIKGALRQHEPCTSYRLYDGLLHSPLEALPSVLSSLPSVYYRRLRTACIHLREIAAHEGVTRMSLSNLAKVWGSILARRDETPATDLKEELRAASDQYKVAMKLLDFFGTMPSVVQQPAPFPPTSPAGSTASARSSIPSIRGSSVDDEAGGGRMRAPSFLQAARRQISGDRGVLSSSPSHSYLSNLIAMAGSSSTSSSNSTGAGGQATSAAASASILMDYAPADVSSSSLGASHGRSRSTAEVIPRSRLRSEGSASPVIGPQGPGRLPPTNNAYFAGQGLGGGGLGPPSRSYSGEGGAGSRSKIASLRIAAGGASGRSMVNLSSSGGNSGPGSPYLSGGGISRQSSLAGGGSFSWSSGAVACDVSDYEGLAATVATGGGGGGSPMLITMPARKSSSAIRFDPTILASVTDTASVIPSDGEEGGDGASTDQASTSRTGDRRSWRADGQIGLLISAAVAAGTLTSGGASGAVALGATLPGSSLSPTSPMGPQSTGGGGLLDWGRPRSLRGDSSSGSALERVVSAADSLSLSPNLTGEGDATARSPRLQGKGRPLSGRLQAGQGLADFTLLRDSSDPARRQLRDSGGIASVSPATP